MMITSLSHFFIANWTSAIAFLSVAIILLFIIFFFLYKMGKNKIIFFIIFMLGLSSSISIMYLSKDVQLVDKNTAMSHGFKIIDENKHNSSSNFLDKIRDKELASVIISDKKYQNNYVEMKGYNYRGKMYSANDAYVIANDSPVYRFDADKNCLVKVNTLNVDDKIKVMTDCRFISNDRAKIFILRAESWMQDLANRISIRPDSYFFKGIAKFSIVIIDKGNYTGYCLIAKENISLASVSKTDYVIIGN